MSKLKPCPFCGETQEIMSVYNGCGSYWAECKTCHAQGPCVVFNVRYQSGRASAVKNWNKRSEPKQENTK